LKISQEKLKSLKVLISSKKNGKCSVDLITTNLMKEKKTGEEFKDQVEIQSNDLPLSNTLNEEKIGLGVNSFTTVNNKFKKSSIIKLSTILSLPENSAVKK